MAGYLRQTGGDGSYRNPPVPKRMSETVALPGRRRELRSLQAGRAIASLLVCAFHLSVLLGASQGHAAGTFYGVTWWGFRGVDFFFVLSGFIILFAHRGDIGRRDRAGRYVVKRITRVYPLYWFYTGLVLALSAVGAGTMLIGLNRPVTLLSSLLLVRFGAVDPPLAVAWTLFHEIVFYAAFTTLILNRRLGIAVFAAWLLAILALRIWPTPHTPVGTLFSPYNLNFFFGMLAYAVYRIATASLAKVMIVAGACAVTLLILADAKVGGSLAMHIGFAAAFATLIAGFSALERHGLDLRTGPLMAIGNASYSLYLVHATMQVYLLKGLLHWNVLGWLPMWTAYLILLAGTVAIGMLTHLLAERPLARLARRSLDGIGRPAPRHADDRFSEDPATSTAK